MTSSSRSLRLFAVGALVMAITQLGCNAIFGVDDLEYDRLSTSTWTGGGGWQPLETYQYRRQLTIGTAEHVALPAGYSLFFFLDHADLVANGKSRDDGTDVRIARNDGGAWTEIHRVLEPTSSWNDALAWIWFKTLDTTADEDTSYWVFYGADAPATPLEDPQEVFLQFDEFEGELDDWSPTYIGNATGTATNSDGMLRIEATTGNIWDTTDDFMYVHRPISGDFVAAVCVNDVGGHLPDWAKVGGVMLRESIQAGSRNVTLSEVPAPSPVAGRTQRVAADGTTESASVDQIDPLPGYFRLSRRSDEITAAYSTDGLAWRTLGVPLTFLQPLVDPVLIGVPFANVDNGGQGWVEIDGYRARVATDANPLVIVGEELTGPF